MNDLLKQRGVIAAALTPWDAHGNVDLAAFDAQIDWIAAQSGSFVAPSSGSATSR